MLTSVKIKNLVLTGIGNYALSQHGDPNSEAAKDFKLYLSIYQHWSCVTEPTWKQIKEKLIELLDRMKVTSRRHEIITLLIYLQTGTIKDLETLQAKLSELKEAGHFGIRGKRGSAFFQIFDDLIAKAEKDMPTAPRRVSVTGSGQAAVAVSATTATAIAKPLPASTVTTSEPARPAISAVAPRTSQIFTSLHAQAEDTTQILSSARRLSDEVASGSGRKTATTSDSAVAISHFQQPLSEPKP